MVPKIRTHTLTIAQSGGPRPPRERAARPAGASAPRARRGAPLPSGFGISRGGRRRCTQPTHNQNTPLASRALGWGRFVWCCTMRRMCACDAPLRKLKTLLFARRGGRLQPTLRSLAPCSRPHTDLSSPSSPVPRPLTTLKPCATRNLLPSSTREARQPTHPTYNLRPSSTCEARQPTLGGP